MLNGISGYGSGYDYTQGYKFGKDNDNAARTQGRVNGQEDDSEAGKVGDEVKKAGRKSSPAECETCKHRKYQDGSDENDVSFQTATHIDPAAAGAKVRAHEQEHVANAYEKAEETGGKVLSVGVSLHTAICPECGRVYVAGGVTHSIVETPKGDQKKDEDNPYEQQKKAIGAILNTGNRSDYEV